MLEEVIKEHPVFLNRAPTLHRLGIQAFEPVLVEGKAIQIHPLVCAAFNADFDGDQMAVHLPLSSEAQAEARILMLSAHNILSPAHGRPIAVPSQDMIIGCYYLTEVRRRRRRRGPRVRVARRGGARVRTALLGARRPRPVRARAARQIKVRMPVGRFPEDQFPTRDDKHADRLVRQALRSNGDGAVLVETHARPAPLQRGVPARLPVHGPHGLKKRELTAIVGELVERYTRAEVAESLDHLKDLGFEYSTRAGLTISIADVKTPQAKAGLLDHFEGEADEGRAAVRPRDHHRRRAAPEGDRDLDRRHRPRPEAMEDEMSSEQFNPIDMMVGSGARGNVMQVRQIAGMRGLVANPRGEIIPRPIKSNFREGLSVLEYFISTHGARKGLADTALRTADSGYLTRRLVDVAQELIVRDERLRDDRAASGSRTSLADAELAHASRRALLGRCLAEDVKLPDGTTMPRDTELDDDDCELLADDPSIDRVRVRSVLTCETIIRCLRHAATARCSRPASPSTSARPSASSPPSRSVSPAPS